MEYQFDGATRESHCYPLLAGIGAFQSDAPPSGCQITREGAGAQTRIGLLELDADQNAFGTIGQRRIDIILIQSTLQCGLPNCQYLATGMFGISRAANNSGEIAEAHLLQPVRLTSFAPGAVPAGLTVYSLLVRGQLHIATAYPDDSGTTSCTRH